jgi:hypothetical protein
MNDPRARPTLYVPLIGIPFLLIFFGGGIAFAVAQRSAAERVKPLTTPIAWIADETRVPNGWFVEIEGTFVSGGEEDIHLEDAPDVMVTVAESVPLGKPTRVRGRVCNMDRASMCGAKRSERLLQDRRTRVLAVGMTPESVRASAMKGWLVAACGLVVYVGIVVFSRRRRRGPARVAEERTWTLPYGAEEIAARIRGLADEDRFVVIDDGPGRIVFIQGYSENAARGWGVRRADVFPRRATLTWQSSPREPTQVTARIEEDLQWWPAALSPTMDRLARESIASTIGGMQRVLGVR